MTNNRVIKSIRLKGLLAFVIIMLLLALFWLLAVDGIVRRTIERTGTVIVGAKVELANADLRLFPLGVTLTGLEVTDPEHPMKNAFEVSRISFGIEGAYLLRRKIIIKEMNVTGLSFNTERKSSGALGKIASTKKSTYVNADAAAGIGTDLFKLPDPDVIIAKVQNASLKAIEGLKEEVKKSEADWKLKLKKLPAKKEFQEYKRRFDAIKSKKSGNGVAALLSGAASFVELQKDIKTDLDKIKGAQKEIQKITAGFEMKIAAVKKSPERELKKVLKQYRLSSGGAGTISSMLLNDRANALVTTALKWHARLGPVVERVRQNANSSKSAEVVKPARGRGVTVRFKEKNPVPDLLIKKLNFSVTTEQGNFTGSATNITPDAEVLGIAMKLGIDATETELAKQIKINATVDRTLPASPRDRVTVLVKGADIADLTLYNSVSLPIVIKRAEANLELKADIEGEKIDAKATITLKGLELRASDTSKGAKRSGLERAILSSLSSIDKLKVGISVSGTTKQYAVKITSGLDSILKSAIEGQMKTQIAAFEKEIRKEISAKTAEPLKGLGGSLSPLKNISTALTDRLGLGGELLKNSASPKTGKKESDTLIPALPFKLPF